MTTPYAANLVSIREAKARIAPYAHVTPLLTNSTFDALCERSLFFKCENFQRVGAFKFRGACNAVMKLDDATSRRGVVTHSSGNHAQALALAARLRGIEAHIVMPRTAPGVKRRAVEGYGGVVYECEPTLEARESTAQQVVEKTGATLIPPFNHPDVIAGQGTVALELLEQAGDLDAIIVPVGGGGLCSGVAIAARAVRPDIVIIAAEPELADDAARSKAAGSIQPARPPVTIADGLLTSLGDLTWPVVRDLVDSVALVNEEQIVAAMRLLWERMKIVVEPSGAVAAAVALSEAVKSRPKLRRVGVILSGGNVDLDRLPWLHRTSS